MGESIFKIIDKKSVLKKNSNCFMTLNAVDPTLSYTIGSSNDFNMHWRTNSRSERLQPVTTFASL